MTNEFAGKSSLAATVQQSFFGIACLLTLFSSPGVASDDSLHAVLEELNKAAEAHPESQGSQELTVESLVANIEAYFKENKQSGIEERDQKKLLSLEPGTVLPDNISIRQFFRYSRDNVMLHGRWVRIIVQRPQAGPVAVPVSEEILFARPMTLFERHVETTNAKSTLLGRPVTYFDEPPKFDAPQELSVDYEPLVEKIRSAVSAKDTQALLALTHQEDSHRPLEKFAAQEWKEVIEKGVKSAKVVPCGFSGTLRQVQSLKWYGPNLNVEGFVVLTLPSKLPRPKELWLEVGVVDGTPKIASYKLLRDTSGDLANQVIGNLSTSGGHILPIGDNRYEFSSRIEAPDALAYLREANFELSTLRP